MARKTWYRTSLSCGRILKIVVRTESARPGPFDFEEVTGVERFWHILGRNMLILEDWRTRWTSRL